MLGGYYWKMKDHSLISNKFSDIISNKKFIDDFYDDSYFASYYHEVSQKTVDDINWYKKILSREDAILEIGTGSGRVFLPLLLDGFDIYGIEPSSKMRKLINIGCERIYPYTLQNLEKIPKRDIQEIIIPATTVSLFPKDDFEEFLKNSKKIFPNVKRVFLDFLDTKYFVESNDIVKSEVYRDEKCYFTNFILDDYVVFNIVTKDKCAVSKKYLYSIDYFTEISLNYGFNYEIIFKNKFYYFLKITL